MAEARIPEVLLERYLAGDLTAAERARIEAACADSPQVAARLAELSAARRAFLEAHPAPVFAARVAARVEAEPSKRPLFSLWLLAPSGAAAVAVLLTVVYARLDHPSDTEALFAERAPAVPAAAPSPSVAPPLAPAPAPASELAAETRGSGAAQQPAEGPRDEAERPARRLAAPAKAKAARDELAERGAPSGLLTGGTPAAEPAPALAPPPAAPPPRPVIAPAPRKPELDTTESKAKAAAVPMAPTEAKARAESEPGEPFDSAAAGASAPALAADEVKAAAPAAARSGSVPVIAFERGGAAGRFSPLADHAAVPEGAALRLAARGGGFVLVVGIRGLEATAYVDAGGQAVAVPDGGLVRAVRPRSLDERLVAIAAAEPFSVADVRARLAASGGSDPVPPHLGRAVRVLSLRPAR